MLLRLRYKVLVKMVWFDNIDIYITKPNYLNHHQKTQLYEYKYKVDIDNNITKLETISRYV